MRPITVAAATLDQTPLDWDGNVANVREAISMARERGASVLCLPELCLTGYGCEDAFHAPHVQLGAMRALEAILPDTRGLAVSVGLPIWHRNALVNTAALLVDGRLVGLTAKQFLAGDGIHYEPRWFKPWPANVRTDVDTPVGRAPLGDLLYQVGDVSIGFEICEDAWVASRPGADLGLAGVDIVLNPSASHFAFGKSTTRERIVLEGSRAFGVTYAYANLAGNEAGRVIYDGGALVACSGAMLARGPRFPYRPVSIAVATVDLEQTRVAQARSSSRAPAISAVVAHTVAVEHELPRAPLSSPREEAPPAWWSSEHKKEEELARAVALGLFDYCVKSRSNGFVVSLSGGCDSTAVAYLGAAAIHFAVAELGLDETKRRLAHAPGVAAATSARAIVGATLTTLYQATRNSGEVTRAAAREVASALGAQHHDLDVEPLVRAYVGLGEGALARSLTWETDDVALQDVQARVRGPSAWLLANVRGALLLATSNRSEAAVGYATMDGDTCGGLSPIAGIDKNFLRRFVRWLEVEGPAEIGPMPALGAVTRQQPTAELRPPSAHQTDEDDLMPYDLLDFVERAAILDKQSPADVLARAEVSFPQHSPAALSTWVGRFYRLWCRNQWKRERYAPSFHLDDESLDPRTWCRFPILSSGYARELRELAGAPSEER